jgi:hypothetical protein
MPTLETHPQAIPARAVPGSRVRGATTRRDGFGLLVRAVARLGYCAAFSPSHPPSIRAAPAMTPVAHPGRPTRRTMTFGGSDGAG